jgi:hypothetical protein
MNLDARHMLLRLTASGLKATPSADDWAAAREQFAARHWLKLPGFLDDTLRARVLDLIDRAAFYERVHPNIGTELCVEPGALTGTLAFLMNDPGLFERIRDLTGCDPVGCFDGRIYRLVPGAGHYDSWHSDLGMTRMVALSLNLGREPFQGGALQIRRADSTEVLADVFNPTPGDAIIFRVHQDLRHRVEALTGTVPRTAWAGWFCQQPSYAELWARRRQGDLSDQSAH